MLSNSVLKQLSVPADQDVPMAMDRQAYLSAIAPQIVNTDAQETSPEAGVDGADVIGSDMRIEGEVLEVLHKSLTAMFRKHGVANQVNIRQWLMEFPAAGAASEASQANDQALHEAVTSGGQFVCIRGSYLAARTGSPQTDPFRAVVLDAFGSKDLVKRSELVAEAKKRGLNISEAMFMKVMRAVCLPRPGGFWCLKPGWDGS
ncbi:unnamed protein product [Ostreobium quekettii]|uniref:Uncharacterized protein n=1 Tax=Ostreobium quekettii TaxID=121088 RepID=A0A8S1IVH4_9CHLO|nr:unnamed protein product [Ostreobium quekettii]|eukprot:evm.model.scf_818.5 EVM.evm.TU.scf_818.5   scf_818:19438-22576(+)